MTIIQSKRQVIEARERLTIFNLNKHHNYALKPIHRVATENDMEVIKKLSKAIEKAGDMTLKINTDWLSGHYSRRICIKQHLFSVVYMRILNQMKNLKLKIVEGTDKETAYIVFQSDDGYGVFHPD